MKVLPSTDPVVMSLRSTSGCFGVLAMLTGAVLVVSVFAPGAGRGGDDMPWYIGLPFGLGLLAAGTYRRTIRIDWNSGNVIHRKSLVGYAFQQTTYLLDAFDTVYLGHIRRHSGDSTTSKYHATLRGSSSLTIMESGIVKQSRTVAESVAVFLHVKLIDSVTGHVIVREPGLLQLSVGQRAQKSGGQQPMPEAPADIQTELEFLNDGTVVLKIPPAGWSTRMMLSTWPCWLAGVFFLWLPHGVFDRESTMGEYVGAIFPITVGCVCIFGSVAFVLSYFTRRVTVTVSAQELHLDSASLFRRYRRTLSGDDIQDVVAYNIQQLGQSAKGNSRPTNFMIGGIGIRGGNTTLNFGNHLREAEQKFLRQLIRAVLER